MSATIVLPTFRRPESLPWALASILLQTYEGARKVVVVNNGGEEGSVENAVASAVERHGNNGWDIKVVHRKPPLDPVSSWYRAIFDNASTGDVVLLHGDDDLLLPGTLQARAAALESTGADFLLTRSVGGLFFDAEVPDVVLASQTLVAPPGPATMPSVIEVGQAMRWEPGFIGTHCYRNGAVLQRAYEQACLEASRLPIARATALTVVPLLLPIPVAERGKLAVLEHTGCIRGQSRQTVTRARLGHTNWAPGIIYAASLRILCGAELGSRSELEPWRELMRSSLAGWYVPSISARATRHQLSALGLASPRTHLARYAREVVSGVRLVAVYALGLQGMRLRWKGLAAAAGYRSVSPGSLVDEIYQRDN